MTTILIILAVLVLFILIALKFGFGKKEAQSMYGADERQAIIHMSGIYSITRKSPRAGLAAVRPSETEIRSYLDGVDKDTLGRPISQGDRRALLKHWKAVTEANLLEIESGDKNGVAFYYYDYPKPCPVCVNFINKGHFVTRDEIYKNPQIIPPFHLGCTCTLNAHQGCESKLRDTVLVGTAPLLAGGVEPALPDWTNIVSLSASAAAKG
jgi:hypothetical protein